MLIVDVGYNESAAGYREGIDRIMRAAQAQGATGVVWVTLRETRDIYRQTNATIRAAQKRWPQLQVADWNAYSRGKPWFSSDGLHMGPIRRGGAGPVPAPVRLPCREGIATGAVVVRLPCHNRPMSRLRGALLVLALVVVAVPGTAVPAAGHARRTGEGARAVVRRDGRRAPAGCSPPAARASAARSPR